MAKQTPKPAATNNAAAGGPTPYPSNWGKMSQAERQEWMRVNRPNRNANAPAPAPAADRPAARPEPAAAPARPEGSVPVKLRVAKWKLQVGDREPVECDSAALGETMAEEMRAFENDHQEPEPPAIPPEDEDDF